MQKFLITIMLFIVGITSAQKTEGLISLAGSEYVVYRNSSVSRSAVEENYLEFVNTKTGKIIKRNLLGQVTFVNLEYVKIDSLGIDLVMVSMSANSMKSPRTLQSQLLFFTKEGNPLGEIILNGMSLSQTVINRQTGTIVLILTGDYSSKSMTPPTSIKIYDLKTFKEIK